MGITGSAISVSQEIYIAFKHLLSLRQNLLHHDPSADHLLRNTFPPPPPECIFCGKDSKRKIKKSSIWTTESLSKFEYGGGATILETAENSSDYIICSEKLKVMIYLLVRLSIIDHVIKNTFVNQLILVWTLI